MTNCFGVDCQIPFEKIIKILPSRQAFKKLKLAESSHLIAIMVIIIIRLSVSACMRGTVLETGMNRRYQLSICSVKPAASRAAFPLRPRQLSVERCKPDE